MPQSYASQGSYQQPHAYASKEEPVPPQQYQQQQQQQPATYRDDPNGQPQQYYDGMSNLSYSNLLFVYYY